MSADPVAAGRRDLLAAAVLAALVLLAYAPALRGGFVWDDRPHIAENPRLESWRAVAEYLGRPEGRYYRPLVFISYAVDRAVSGTGATGFHLTNVLLHLLVTLLLVAVARRGGVSRHASLCAGAVFAVHPVQSEAVAYISGRTDLVMTAAALASWGALLGRGPALARGLRAAALGGVAMLSKESGFALVALWPWVAWRRSSSWGERAALAGPGLLVGALLLWLRPGGVPVPAGGVAPVTQLAGSGWQILSYTGTLLWPARLQVDCLTLLPSTAAGVAAGLAVLAGAAVAAGWGMSRRGPAGDWAAWTVAFYLPVANLAALYPALAGRALFAPEHNLYAPLAGIAVLLGLGAERLVDGVGARGRRAAAVAAAGLVLAWVGRTAVRAGDWQNDERLFGQAAAAGSHSPRVWFNYGNALLQRGDAAGAAAAFEQATRRAPGDAEAWANLGVAQQARGDLDAAERAYRRAVEIDPANALVFENLGTLYVVRGQLGAAGRAFAAALRLDPRRERSRQALETIGRLGLSPGDP